MGSGDGIHETVRDRVEAPIGDGRGTVIRLKLRVDIDLTGGQLCSSIVGYKHPSGYVILNKVWSPTDLPLWSTRAEHINLELRHILNEHCEPFPI